MKNFEIKKYIQAFSKDEVFLLRKISFDLFEDYKQKIKNLPRPIVAYDMLERSKDRFEISTSGESKEQIFSLLLKNNSYKKIQKKISIYLSKFWNGYFMDIGLLPTEGEVKPGPWHRDAHFYDNFSINSKAYYFTILIYLDDNSGTEFLKGSSLSKSENQDDFKNEIISPKTGDLVFFDGRIIHRGLENKSKNKRMALYITYTAKEYIDEDAHLPELKEIIKTNTILQSA